MLPNENKPFADYHRELLDGRRQMLNSFLANPNSIVMTIDRSTAAEWLLEIDAHIRAFDRYEACLRDEQTTKNRYEKERNERRLEEFRRNKS